MPKTIKIKFIFQNLEKIGNRSGLFTFFKHVQVTCTSFPASQLCICFILKEILEI